MRVRVSYGHRKADNPWELVVSYHVDHTWVFRHGRKYLYPTNHQRGGKKTRGPQETSRGNLQKAQVWWWWWGDFRDAGFGQLGKVEGGASRTRPPPQCCYSELSGHTEPQAPQGSLPGADIPAFSK